MRLRHLALAPTLILIVAACSGGSSAASPSVAAAPSAATSASPAVETIEVKLGDALRMEPAQMTVKAGQAVRFVVTNTGATDHELYLGDVAAQEEHGMEMTSMGGMMAHDEEHGIGLKPGQTKELTHTFAKAGAFLAGCHVDGHYDGGMNATITVTE